MKTPENIAKHIRNLNYDIRAEVIINDLQIQHDNNQEQYVIQKEGQFSRAYRFDVLDAQVADDNDSSQILCLKLSRDSMYDTLPEGISHAPKNDHPEKDVDDMISEYNEQKKNQKSARLFFQPFENEFFRYGVETENFESNFLSALNSSNVSDIFYNFWNISKGFPPLLISKFIRLLPFAYKIVGNIPLAAHILSILLEEKVEVRDRDYQEYTDINQSVLLGNTRLGIDSITGIRYDDYSRHLNIKIGPLEQSSFMDFIDEGSKKRFVNLFYEHFLPIEIEINTIILLSKEKQKFELNSKKEVSVLGYNTCI
nr:type VI secretion system baseplate subunit TssG [uncultured Chryseobacterium sp.]